MSLLRRILAFPYLVLRALVDAAGRVLTGVLGCALFTAGVVLWLTFGHTWPGIALIAAGILLIGRAIA